MSNPIKASFKTEWFSIFLIILAGVASLYFYQRFPREVATHWNFQGEANGYSSSFWAAFLSPIIMLGIYLLFLIIPYLDPKKEQYVNFYKTFHRFKDLMLSFLFVIFFMTDLNGLGYPIDIGFWVPIMVGILFMAIGRLMDKIKMNWFFGIRTPWTLSSKYVWDKTHQLSGKVFILAGLIIALVSFVPETLKIALFILAIALIALTLPIYSYIIYSQEKKKK